MKMYSFFIFVISIGFFLIFGAVDSHRELILISTPQKTDDKQMQTKLTCVASHEDSALFWLSQEKYISSLVDCAITWEYTNCQYDPSTSSVKSIRWSGNYKKEDWEVELDTEYSSVPEGLRTRLQELRMYAVMNRDRHHISGYTLALVDYSKYSYSFWYKVGCESPIIHDRHRYYGNGYCKGHERHATLNTSKPLVFFGNTNRNYTLWLYLSDGMSDSVPSSDFREFNPKHVSGGKWSAYSVDWNETTLSINGNIVRNWTGNESLEVIKFEESNATVYPGYCYLNSSGKNPFLQFEIDLYGDDFCLDLLVGFSPNCKFRIEIGLPLKKRYWISNNSRSEFLWVNYTIKEKLALNDTRHFLLTIYAEYGKSSSCKWFFHSMRPCQSNSSKRKSRRTSVLTDSVLNPIKCQEILRSGKSVVVSPRRDVINIRLNVPEICLDEKETIFDQECGDSCNGTLICNPSSCTYALGFKDRRCDQGPCIPYPHYSLQVYIYYCGNSSAKDSRTVLFEMQNEENPEKWESISGNRINDNTWSWPNEIIGNLQPDGIYSIRAKLNGTERSSATKFNVSYLVPVTLGKFTAKPSQAGIVELNWQYLHIYWRKVKWFYLRIDVLNPKKVPFQYPVGKFYPVKKNESKYSGKAFLETDAKYKITLYILTDKDKNKLVFGADTNCETVKNDVMPRENTTINRNETSIFIERPSILNNISGGSVYVVIYGSFDCGSELSTPHDDIIEWEVTSYKNSRSMPESLQISNVSECELLPDKAYVVKVLVMDSDGKRYLFVINVDKLRQSYVGSIVASVISLLCFLTLIYFSYRYLIAKRLLDRFMNPYQKHDLSMYEPETVRYDSKAHSKKLVAFENSVKRDAQDGVLEQQFMRLPKGLVRPCEYGRLPDNQWKNRNGSPIAYDDTRVMLVQKPKDRYSDYINANYIQGYLKKNAYIATQAPLPETVEDFWRMVWQEDVRIICMLVDLVEGEKVMSEMYWPDVGRKVEYGDFIVSNLAEQEFSDYTCRTFVVSRRARMEQRQIDHLQYRCWTDQEIPVHSHSFLEFLQKLRSIAPGPGPIVVHCCADIGRTGCVILCDICVCQIYDKETVNVRSEAEKMYHARANMLHNHYQYTLAHLMPIQFRRALATVIPFSELSLEKIQEMKNDSSEHMHWLKCFAWMHEALRPLEPLRPTHPENVSKNRFPKLMPVGPSLMTLPKYPPEDQTSDYISAVSVDGVKTKKQYLASQLPMPGTLTDFWRLIVQENVEIIVILQNPDLDDPTCCAIIARDKTVIPYPFVKVETKMSLESNEYFTTTMLLVTDSTEKPTKTRTITAISFNDWRWNQITSPPPPEALIKLWFACHAIKRTTAPTLVLCYDGVTASGIYIALSFILEKMCRDQECDVIAAVQAVHRSRSEFVQFSWQINYLYDAVLKYMDLSEEYENFN